MRNKNGIKRVKSQKRYPVDLKRKIGKSYLAGEASYAVLAEENGLKNKSVVREFVKWYRKELLKEERKKKLQEKLNKELKRAEGFLFGIQKKLSNERFVNNAPDAVVTNERNKLADGQAKLKNIEESLANLGCA